jgi:hypothetical protein
MRPEPSEILHLAEIASEPSRLDKPDSGRPTLAINPTASRRQPAYAPPPGRHLPVLTF